MCPLFWWRWRECLESLALNVSADFASKNFILFAKVLRTLLAPRSNPDKALPWGFFCPLIPNKEGTRIPSLLEMAGVEPASDADKN